MTEQELEKKIRQSGVEDRESVEYFIDLAKAYADAQVEASVARQQPIFEAAMNVKNAEIKRLREFAQQCFKSPEKLAVIHYFENGEFDYCDLVPLQDAAINSLSPAPATEDKFSVSGYPKECTPTIEQLTENDDLTMVQRLEKRMPPFHGIAPVTEQCPDILQTILALPDDTSAAYIKSVIYDHTTKQ